MKNSPLRERNLPAKHIGPAKVKALEEFLSWGLHVKENPREVSDVAVR
jgi:hypothetical protein